MIDGLRPYPAMKDSGVPWLGEVPAHWAIQSIASLGELFKGKGGSKEDEVPEGLPCVRYGDLYTKHDFFIEQTNGFISPKRSSAYTPIYFGDVLFAASGETIEEIGKSAVNLLRSDAYCGGDLLVFRPNIHIVAKFLGYAAGSPASQNQKSCMGRGFTVAHIYGGQVKRLMLPLPPLPEQTAIVRFLDHADRRIRRYIRAKKKLIKLLEEQKQVIIHRAVTLGLDPDVRLKPSGVEWLGEVPEHWEVLPLKRAFVLMDYGISDSGTADGAIPVLTMGHIREGSVTVPEAGGVDLVADSLLLQDRDLLFNRTNSAELVAKVGLFHSTGKPTTFASYLVRMRAVPGNSPEFLNYLLNDTRFLAAARREAIPSLHQSNLNPTRYGRLPIPFPPASEQVSIAETIPAQILPITTGIAQAHREITLLQELRTRLIADVVTGKLDVREAAARLPEVPEDDEPLAEDEIELDDEALDDGEADENDDQENAA